MEKPTKLTLSGHAGFERSSYEQTFPYTGKIFMLKLSACEVSMLV